MREIEYNCEGWTDVWVYNCGWRIKGSHPYLLILDGGQYLNQPIGILQFFKETGILPPKQLTK